MKSSMLLQQVSGFFILLFGFHVSSLALSNSSFSFSTSSRKQLCHPEESFVLLQFLSSLSIKESASPAKRWDFWKREDIVVDCYPKTVTWKESEDCCSWDGVTCDYATGHVIGIDISCSWLSGTFNPNSTLFLLPHLERLNLAYNDFKSSQISPHFGNFRNLIDLNLSYSSFFGNIPLEISWLSSLASLDLSYNSLELHDAVARQMFHNITNIKVLHLSGINLFNGSMSALKNLSSSLVSLALSSCDLIGEFPNDIFKLPNLHSLALSGNLITVDFPNSNGSKRLESLDLSGIPFSGELQPSIGNFISLKVLGLYDCNFLGTIPNFIKNLVNLTHLGLGDNHFSGHIPTAIGNLQQLVSLHIYYNSLTGPIPSFLGNLTKLTSVLLDGNSFTGDLPKFLFNFSNLSVLSASNNKLLGTIPVPGTRLSSLKILRLSSNRLNGSIPDWIYDLPSLQKLDLSHNMLTGSIGSFKYNSLQVLQLDQNLLQGPISQSIYEQVNLKYLYLSNLSGIVNLDILSKLSYLESLVLNHMNLVFDTTRLAKEIFPNLLSLNLHSCNLTEFPYFLSHKESFVTLILSYNNIQGDIPQWLYDVGKGALRRLDLSGNYLTGTFQVSWKNIEILILYSNFLTGEIPVQICNLTWLSVLDLSHNKFNGNLPRCLGNLRKILVIDVRENNLSGTISTTFTSESSLKYFNLNHNQIEGSLPPSLGKCQELVLLDLGNNKISDTFPSWLGVLQNLQVLVLQSNKFHGPINVETKFSFSALRIMDLSYNKFGGPLPRMLFENLDTMMVSDVEEPNAKYMDESFYHISLVLTMKGLVIELPKILTILKTIDMSCNNFSGNIPPSIALLKSLNGLNLSHNNFEGSIPLSFGNLSSLEWLDLSSNKLVGQIPEELTILTFLEKLNLSNNHLFGSIPRGRQFDTFENNSYSENIDLCGPPLSKTCEDPESFNPSLLEEYGGSESQFGLSWKVVVAGYASGFIFGVSMAYIVTSTGKPSWLANVERGIYARLRRWNWPKKGRRN